MAHIYKFPALEDIPKKHDPRQRIFYIGHRPAGETPQEGIQHVYLRKGYLEKGKRKWSVISYEEEIEFEEEEEVDEVIDFAVVEGSPIFPGCKPSKKSSLSERKEEDKQCLNKGIMKHIKKNFKYPKIAKEMGIQEKIYVKFIIDKTGLITDVKVLRGEDKYLKEEAMRLVQSIPSMTPANQRGKPVSVNYTIPINFMLN